MIPKEHLYKFKEFYKKRFNKELTDQEALESGTRLIRLIELIYKPMTQKDYDILQKRKEEIM